jgi:hypothetical protein
MQALGLENLTHPSRPIRAPLETLMKLKTYKLNTLALDLSNTRRWVWPIYGLIFALIGVASMPSVPLWLAVPAGIGSLVLCWLWVRRVVRYQDLRRVARIAANLPASTVGVIWPYITIEEPEPRTRGDRVFHRLFRQRSDAFERIVDDPETLPSEPSM